MSVVEAVQRDLDAIGSDDLARSGLALTALALAAELDASNSATSKSMCARALIDVLEQLRALSPARRTADDVDDLATRRAERRAAARVAGSADLPGS